ncbi:MAG TPA: fumarylacetoacetase [Gemmatimonadaceae bacterium]|nr:fumarylacetoacetase [Gemmatimonadaceae bacterium]
MNETHDPTLKSWVESANAADSDFPIQNLPFGVFSRKGETERRVGVAIGDQIVDIGESLSANLWTGKARDVARFCDRPTMDELMQAPRDALSEFRSRLSQLLSGTPGDDSAINPLPPGALVPMSEAEMRSPTRIGDYTDFYASIYHATNVGKLFRPESPLFPNYKYVPIGYHGRASSIVLSGSEVRRPNGQTLATGSKTPTFGPSQMLDYEAEVGFFVGQGNALGQPVPIEEAEDHIFGICIVNDWSARDIQSWEYQPLGPFLSKNFATSISPWVVTWEALEPYRTPAFFRPPGDPQPLAYLSSEKDKNEGGLDLTIEVYIRSMLMREGHLRPSRLSSASLADMYWTPAQMLTHHTSGGCNMAPGDLFASGTVSGPEAGSQGCLLELTRRGAEAIVLPTGEERRFLHDGDEIIMKAFLQREGAGRIGLGECAGLIVASSAR